MSAQSTLLRVTRLQLAFVLVAALGGAVSGVLPGPFGALLAVGGFLLALVVSGYIAQVRPEREWYDGRAVAESCKTLAWRYAVGARPFDLAGSDPRTVDAEFVTVISDVAGALSFAAVPKDSGPAITTEMRDLRGADLEARKRAYETGRILDQQKWYAEKASFNDDRARNWKVGILGLNLVGVLVGIAMLTGSISMDGVGLVAAGVGAATAWSQLKQHESLARAYAVAASELAAIQSLISHQLTEAEWSDFVDQAEEAISREHTLWRASRGVVVPLPAARRV